jgi:hypothetical protein
VTDDGEETDVPGRGSGRGTGRDVITPLQTVWSRSIDQREKAIDLFRLGV